MNITFDQILERFNEYAANPQSVHPKIHGVIVGLLDTACGGKDNRYLFAVKLGAKAHSLDWTEGQWWAMYQMCKPDKVDDFGNPNTVKGKWSATNENFQAIVDCVMRKIADNSLQTKMFDEKALKAEMGFYDD